MSAVEGAFVRLAVGLMQPMGGEAVQIMLALPNGGRAPSSDLACVVTVLEPLSLRGQDLRTLASSGRGALLTHVNRDTYDAVV